MTTVPFEKWEGLGNDFVVLDRRDASTALSADLARRLADRHFGVGCDQVMTIERSDDAAFAFRYGIYNADGSRAGQCGNGLRCVVRWLAEDYASRLHACRAAQSSRCPGCSRAEQVLEALEVVDEVIICAIGREQEQRDEDGRRCHCYDGSTPCIHHPAPWRAEQVSDEAWAIYDAAGEWVREVMKALYRVWRRPVELHTVVEKKPSALRWDGAVAQARMDNLLSAYYGKDKLHAVLAPADVLSIGIISSLKGVGYGTPKQPMPVITGQDADLPSVKALLRGDQASTVFKDTRELARVTVNLIDAVLSGKKPEVNDTKTYNNGVKVVPSYLLKPVAVDAANWNSVLIGSGYYTEAQVK